MDEAEEEEGETKSRDGHPDQAPEHGLAVVAAFEELTIEEQGASSEKDSQNTEAETKEEEGQPQPGILDVYDPPTEWGYFFHQDSPSHE